MKLIGNILAIILCTSLVGLYGAEFHVAPDGDDANPGTAMRPFATLQRAQDAARASRVKGQKVSVILHGGIYRLEHTLYFNEMDSGTAQSPVVWRVAPGEEARIIGGLLIPTKVIKPVTDTAVHNRVIDTKARQNLREIDLSGLGIKDFGQVGPRGFSRPYLAAPVELFIDKAPMPLSRWPKADEPLVPIGEILDTGSITRNGEAPLRGGRFIVNTNRPKLWSNVSDIWISGLFHHGYADDTVSLASITDSTNGLVFSTVQPHVYGFNSGKPWNAWYALNVLEEISRPGEYAVDRQTSKLFFLPPAGMDLRNSEVLVSTLSKPLIALEKTSHIRFENMVFEASRGMGVYVEGGGSCVLSSCVFRNLGMLGVCVGQGAGPDPLSRTAVSDHPVSRQLGSFQQHLYENPDFDRQGGQNHRIENCAFYNLGAGGISLGGGDRKSLTSSGNAVYNCEIHNFNRWDRSYKAGVNIDGVGNRIQHCLIYDAPGSAIYLHGNNHVIENNEVHHVMQEGDDMGAFYMGRDPTEFGNVIRNNYFHDIGFGRTHRTWAIYYDDGACGSEAYGNVFVRAGRSGTFLIGGGKYNLTHDNIFVDCELGIQMDDRQRGWNRKQIAAGGIVEQRYKRVKADQPPFSVRYPQLARFWQDDPSTPADPVEHNLFVRCKKLTNGKPEWGPFMGNWETKDDPGFVDISKGDYRLKPDAEAFRNIPGFKPGDFLKMGLVK
jgi:hypothetical protein